MMCHVHHLTVPRHKKKKKKSGEFEGQRDQGHVVCIHLGQLGKYFVMCLFSYFDKVNYTF